MVRKLSILALALTLAACAPRENRIVVGSKNFTEQLILGEIMSQQIEAKSHLAVERRFYLAGSYICDQAILGGRIDIYPEYTGTALTAILKQKPEGNREAVYQRVKSEYAKRFNLSVGEPIGFNDTFGIERSGKEARRFGKTSISQSPPNSNQWRAAFGDERMVRP